jgi:hypothetical protein
MTQRTATEMYRDLREAGFSRSSAITMVAVGLGESGGNDTAVGDVSLEDSTWGPSVGLYQVRTVKSKTGSGTDRDISALMGDPDRQAQAAWDISNNGTDFTPWTVYKSGEYQKYLSQAQAAANQVGDSGFVTVDSTSDFLGGLVGGITGMPLNASGDALSGALSGLSSSLKNASILVAFGGLGLALVLFGAKTTLSPTISRGVRAVGKVAGGSL